MTDLTARSPRHDPIESSPFDEGREWAFLVKKSQSPLNECPYRMNLPARAEWIRGFESEVDDAYQLAYTQARRTN